MPVVGPAGIEPTTSTVEERDFAADWVAPIVAFPIRKPAA